MVQVILHYSTVYRQSHFLLKFWGGQLPRLVRIRDIASLNQQGRDIGGFQYQKPGLLDSFFMEARQASNIL